MLLCPFESSVVVVEDLTATNLRWGHQRLSGHATAKITSVNQLKRERVREYPGIRREGGLRAGRKLDQCFVKEAI